MSNLIYIGLVIAGCVLVFAGETVGVRANVLRDYGLIVLGVLGMAWNVIKALKDSGFVKNAIQELKKEVEQAKVGVVEVKPNTTNVFTPEKQTDLECIECLVNSAKEAGRLDVVEKMRAIHNDFFAIHHDLEPETENEKTAKL